MIKTNLQNNIAKQALNKLYKVGLNDNPKKRYTRGFTINHPLEFKRNFDRCDEFRKSPIFVYS